MGALVSRRVRRTQPQSNAFIDWSNPITQGLVFAYSCSNEAQGWGEDGRTSAQYVKTSDGTVYGRQINTLTGTGGQLLSSASGYLFGDATQTSVKSGVYSLFAFGTGPSSGMQSAIDDDDGVTRRFQFRLNAGKVECIPFYSGGNGDVVAPSALSANDLASGFAMGATVNGTSCAVFQKGAKTSGTLAGTALTPNSTIRIGARKTGTQTWTSGGLSLVAMWNRALTDAEQQSLADNPWQLFKPAPRRLWVAFSASSGTNVNPGAGVLTLTGYAPSVAQSANLAVTPGAGSLTIAGYAPSVTQSATTNVQPGAGALSLTGFAPSVAQSANQSVNPGAGSITLTGYAPTVARTASQSVQPGAGALTLVGYAPLITQGVDNAPRIYAATIMRITTTNRSADLGSVLNATAPISSVPLNIATIMTAAPTNRTADIGPATLNRTVSFP